MTFARALLHGVADPVCEREHSGGRQVGDFSAVLDHTMQQHCDAPVESTKRVFNGEYSSATLVSGWLRAHWNELIKGRRRNKHFCQCLKTLLADHSKSSTMMIIRMKMP
jgi:hypothetical protein